MKTEHMEDPAPASPWHGGCRGLHVFGFHINEAPPGGPQKARFRAEALLSNIAQVVKVPVVSEDFDWTHVSWVSCP
jgi:hypothetical protein